MNDRSVRNDDRELTGRLRDELEEDGAPAPGTGSERAPRDTGRTSGGGSLGHKQPQDVAEATNIRNQPSTQRSSPDRPPRD